MEQCMGLDNCICLIIHFLKDTASIINLLAKRDILNKMGTTIKGTSKITKQTEKEFYMKME